MRETVCAVVVTYNRKDLLLQCLDALLHQTRSVDEILVVDNASTDSTGTAVEQAGFLARPEITLASLPVNVGGAGGFHAGMKRALAGQATWFWLLDDDTITNPDALHQLLSARGRFPDDARPDLLASRVVWTDGSMHPMNVPRLKRGDLLESMSLAAERATVSLRSTSFVSVLIHRRHVEQYGLPIADYFIWNDDVEYTARILRDNFGVMVPASVVVHKTTEKSAPTGPRFYYGVRNTLWMVTKSSAWTREERCKLVAALLVSAVSYVRSAPAPWDALRVVAKGAWHGLVQSPHATRSPESLPQPATASMRR